MRTTKAMVTEQGHRDDLRERLRIPLLTLRQRADLALVLGAGLEPELAAEPLALLRDELGAALTLLGVDAGSTRPAAMKLPRRAV